MAKFRIKKGDKVLVTAGKDKGKESRVLRCLPARERVICEHIAIAKKAVRPTQQNQQGGFREMEKPIHISTVMLICPKCGKPTRVGIKRVDGKKTRVCKKCSAEFE